MNLARVLAVLLLAAPAAALEYPCPTDPGACYFDVGSDGCFDSGVDTLGIALNGAFPNPLPPGTALPVQPGSIVCPPSVDQLAIGPNGAEWRTAVGSHVIMFARRILDVSRNANSAIRIRSGGDVQIRGRVDSKSGSVLVGALGDVVIEGGGRADRGWFANAGGDVTLSPKTKLKGRSVGVSGGGNVLFGSGVKLTAKTTTVGVAGATVTTENTTLRGADEVAITGGDLDARGGLKVISTRSRQSVRISMTGTAAFDALHASARGSVTIAGDRVEIGRPDEKGRIRNSRITARKDHVGLFEPIELHAGSDLAVHKARLTGQTFELINDGSDLVLADSDVNAPGGVVGEVTLQVAPGSTCDVTGTSLHGIALNHDCDLLIGP